jgi:hypothetical protein
MFTLFIVLFFIGCIGVVLGSGLAIMKFIIKLPFYIVTGTIRLFIYLCQALFYKAAYYATDKISEHNTRQVPHYDNAPVSDISRELIEAKQSDELTKMKLSRDMLNKRIATLENDKIS